tara:strand:- start:7756 stop:7944 length:189 start_codon:yes stop_codon:yes gene_type:complete
MLKRKNIKRGLMAAGALALAVAGASGAVALKQKQEDEKKKQMSQSHPDDNVKMARRYSGPGL